MWKDRGRYEILTRGPVPAASSDLTAWHSNRCYGGRRGWNGESFWQNGMVHFIHNLILRHNLFCGRMINRSRLARRVKWRDHSHRANPCRGWRDGCRLSKLHISRTLSRNRDTTYVVIQPQYHIFVSIPNDGMYIPGWATLLTITSTLSISHVVGLSQHISTCLFDLGRLA